jgi:hypothetical protein
MMGCAAPSAVPRLEQFEATGTLVVVFKEFFFVVGRGRGLWFVLTWLVYSFLLLCLFLCFFLFFFLSGGAGRVSYTKHWIGGTWNGDGLNEILDPRLQLDDFQEKVYKSSNASWVSLRRSRKKSASEQDLLAEVRHDWKEEGKTKKSSGGGGKKKRSKPKHMKKPRGEEESRGETKRSTTPPGFY